MIIGVGKVDVALFLEPVPFLDPEEGLGQPLGIMGRQQRVILPDRRQLTEPPPSRRKGGRQMDIRAIVLSAELEVLVNVI
jgi:hypothetical protein